MKKWNIVLLAAALACMPLVTVFAADPNTPPEKPLKEMTIEELLTKIESGPDQTEAFDMFLSKFTPMVPRIDKAMITYRGYGLADGMLLNFEPLPYPGLVVVPLGPAIMAQLGLTGGVTISSITPEGAQSSGLAQYDIITSVGGAKITDVASFYKAITANSGSEKETEFGIIRAGKPDRHKIRLWSPPFGAK